MSDHELKIWPEYFNAVRRGDKTFEIRKDDRAPRFEVGDFVLLKEWDPDVFPDLDKVPAHVNAVLFGEYTGNSIRVEITYITRLTSFGLEDGHCVFAFKTIYAIDNERR